MNMVPLPFQASNEIEKLGPSDSCIFASKRRMSTYRRSLPCNLTSPKEKGSKDRNIAQD